MSARLILVDSVVVDIVLNVDALPQSGSDTLVEHSESFAGGGFNVMAAASRLGLPSVYGGVVGLGPFATMAQEAMREEAIVVATPPIDDVDTGFVVAIVDASGERTFVTSVGAEATLATAQLDELDVTASDLVYFSGYALLHESNSRALLSFVRRIPAETRFLFDPGPIVDDIPASSLDAVFDRVDWFSCNDREARFLTGASRRRRRGATDPRAYDAGRRDRARRCPGLRRGVKRRSKRRGTRFPCGECRLERRGRLSRGCLRRPSRGR